MTGQFADDGTFIINAHTGEVYVTRALDRDLPRGRPVWNFNVLAHDEAVDSSDGRVVQPSLTGYAEVRVVLRDVNDNATVFDRSRLVGKVAEHSRAGKSLCVPSCLSNVSPILDLASPDVTPSSRLIPSIHIVSNAVKFHVHQNTGSH